MGVIQTQRSREDIIEYISDELPHSHFDAGHVVQLACKVSLPSAKLSEYNRGYLESIGDDRQALHMQARTAPGQWALDDSLDMPTVSATSASEAARLVHWLAPNKLACGRLAGSQWQGGAPPDASESRGSVSASMFLDRQESSEDEDFSQPLFKVAQTKGRLLGRSSGPADAQGTLAKKWKRSPAKASTGDASDDEISTPEPAPPKKSVFSAKFGGSAENRVPVFGKDGGNSGKFGSMFESLRELDDQAAAGEAAERVDHSTWDVKVKRGLASGLKKLNPFDTDSKKKGITRMAQYMRKNLSESREIVAVKPNISDELTQGVTKALMDPFTKLTASFNFSSSEFSIFDEPSSAESPEPPKKTTLEIDTPSGSALDRIEDAATRKRGRSRWYDDLVTDEEAASEPLLLSGSRSAVPQNMMYDPSKAPPEGNGKGGGGKGGDGSGGWGNGGGGWGNGDGSGGGGKGGWGKGGDGSGGWGKGGDGSGGWGKGGGGGKGGDGGEKSGGWRNSTKAERQAKGQGKGKGAAAEDAKAADVPARGVKGKGKGKGGKGPPGRGKGLPSALGVRSEYREVRLEEMDEAKIAKSVFGQDAALGDDLLTALTSGAQENFKKKKKDTGKTPRTARQDKDKDVLGRRSICTTDRDKNVAITLKSMARAGVTPREVQQKMLTMDQSLTVEALENLAKIAPNDKELKELKRLQKEMSAIKEGETPRKLSEATEYYNYIGEIAEHIRPMAQVMLFKLQLDTRLKRISARASTLATAAETIRQSKSFGKVLQLVLSLGNSLNAKRTKGFRLSSLLKLADTRSAEDSNLSLLHFLANVMKTKATELLDWYEDLEAPCARAAKTDVEILLMDAGELYTDYSLCQRMTTLLKESQPEYTAKVKEFVSESFTVIESASDELARIFEQYADTYDYYGEDTSIVGAIPGKIQCMLAEGRLVEGIEGYNGRVSNFFDTIVKFIALYKKAVEDNKQKERAMNARKARGEKQKGAKSKLTKKSAAPADGPSSIAEEVARKAQTKAAKARPEANLEPAPPAAPPPALTPAPPQAASGPKEESLPDLTAVKPPAAEEPKAAGKSKSALQQQIAMKAALKLKQMKAAKAAAAK